MRLATPGKFTCMSLKLKETSTSTKYYTLKNPNWWETDQSVIQKHDRGGEPWSTEKQLQLFKWLERDLNP